MGRKLGIVLLWVGFLWGAFVSVQQTGTIDWMSYGVAAAVTLAGVIVLRVTQRRDLTEGGRVARDVDTLRTRLAELESKVRDLHERRDDVDVYSVHDTIDDELMPVIADFVDARESLITAYDMDTYARVMTDFALGERLLNRAWCASADGYIDETWASVERALSALQRSGEALPADDGERLAE
jgi:hypothetical protein